MIPDRFWLTDARPEYGPKKTLYNRYVRWALKGVWVQLFEALATAGGPPTQVLNYSSAVKAHRSASGDQGGARAGDWALERRGGTTKIRALTDEHCRPVAFMLTDGQVADCKAGAELLARMPACDILNGDKGYDSNTCLCPGPWRLGRWLGLSELWLWLGTPRFRLRRGYYRRGAAESILLRSASATIHIPLCQNARFAACSFLHPNGMGRPARLCERSGAM